MRTLSRHPLRWSLTALAIAALVLLAVLYARKNVAPECARLLPESDAIVYFNLRPLRAATHFDQHPLPHDPAYQRFIDATGINFERDLDEAAFALSRQADPTGPNGPVAYSEVFSGSFDARRLTNWLAANATQTDIYAGKIIYSLPIQGRTVRVAVLSRDLVAISNTPTPEQIHAILDHHRAGILSRTEPTLLAGYYKDLPVLSLAWGIGEIGLPLAETAGPAAGRPMWERSPLQLLGLTLPFRLDTTFLASLRWTGALRLRLEQIAPSESAAALSAETLDQLVNVAKVAENNLPARLVDENTRTLVNSIRIVHYNDRAVLTATLPAEFLKKLLSVGDAAAPGR